MHRLRFLMLAAPLLVLAGCADTTSPRIAPASHFSAAPAAGAPAAPQSTVPQLSSDGYHTCALKTDGTVVCWGQNTYGQTTVPTGLTSVKQVGTGQFHTCAVKTDGTVVCWGWSTYGQTTPPADLASAVSVSGGAAHTCALKADATVVCWGYAGDGATSVPAGLASVKQVSAGGYHTCALKTDGTVICWGYNAYGESTVPSGLSSVAQVSGGVWYSCALKTDATVVCWGANGGNNINFGQQNVPSSLTPVSQVSSGGQHTCALETSGTAACWGDNEFGQSTVPGGLVSATQISTGYFHSCALKSDGTVVCWGENADGQATVPPGFNVVVPVPQTIRFTSTAPNPGYVGATYTPTAVATSGLAVVLNASTPGVCSISGGTISLVATGTCVVTADQAGDAAHLAATQQTQSITVVKNPQGITFGSTAPNQPLVGSTYTVAATATSGLTVSFTSLTPLTCRVSGAVASFIAAGGCTIAADQAGNGAYLAAARQTQSVTIITAAQAIQNLVATIGGMRLPGGVTTSLAAPLKNVNTGNVSAACGKVSDFVSGVESKLSGGELTSAQAGQLLQAASAIAASLGCG